MQCNDLYTTSTEDPRGQVGGTLVLLAEPGGISAKWRLPFTNRMNDKRFIHMTCLTLDESGRGFAFVMVVLRRDVSPWSKHACGTTR